MCEGENVKMQVRGVKLCVFALGETCRRPTLIISVNKSVFLSAVSQKSGIPFTSVEDRIPV